MMEKTLEKGYRNIDYIIVTLQYVLASKQKRKKMGERIPDCEIDLISELAKERYSRVSKYNEQKREQKIRETQKIEEQEWEREEARKRDRYYKRI